MPGVRFSAEQGAEAVRLVFEATPQNESQWAAIQSVASKIGGEVGDDACVGSWQRLLAGLEAGDFDPQIGRA